MDRRGQMLQTAFPPLPSANAVGKTLCKRIHRTCCIRRIRRDQCRQSSWISTEIDWRQSAVRSPIVAAVKTRSIWKMLGPFATTSRLTPIHQMSLAGTVARRLRIDVHDNDDNDNAWQRGPLWPHGMGPISNRSINRDIFLTLIFNQTSRAIFRTKFRRIFPRNFRATFHTTL